MGESAVPLQVIEGRLAQIDQAIKDLQLERIMLNRLRQQAEPMRPTSRRKGRAQDSASEDDGPQGASSAIVALVREHPGLRTEVIADRLKDRITTRSKNPRRVIVNSVTNLVNRGRLKNDGTGGWIVHE